MPSARCILNVFYDPAPSTRRLVEDNRGWFIPVHGGSESPVHDNDWMRTNLVPDNIGANISSLNPRLNENTSIYWVWKHYADGAVGNPDWIGFNHYRRYFPPEKIRSLISSGKVDFVVSHSYRCAVSLVQQYATFHVVEDLYTLYSVMPKSDVASFKRYMEHNVMYAPAYIFFMRRDDFFAWCEYAFPVMFELNELIDTTGRTLYNQRAICFLVERLFGFWLAMRIERDHKTAIATSAVFDRTAKSEETQMHELADRE